jgi:hypothetical protein
MKKAAAISIIAIGKRKERKDRHDGVTNCPR